MSAWIYAHHRIVTAVGEHIIAQDALAGADETVGVDKSADFRVIVAALQVVKPGFGWVMLFARRGCPLRNIVFSVGYLPEKGM